MVTARRYLHRASEIGLPVREAAAAHVIADNMGQHSSASARDAHVAALRVLAVSLLKQIETIEEPEDYASNELNLHEQVQKFEAALIRSALERTGGRQRRAARLLGVKVTTLNTKIKRLQISVESS